MTLELERQQLKKQRNAEKEQLNRDDLEKVDIATTLCNSLSLDQMKSILWYAKILIKESV